MTAASTTDWQRCTTCEEMGRGFTYRHLIDGLCVPHALDRHTGKFVKLTHRVYAGPSTDTRETAGYGWLAWWSGAREVRIAKFCRTINDGGRIYSNAIDPNMVVNIEPLSIAEYVGVLTTHHRVIVQHFGRRHNGRIIDMARTRVLVRFRGSRSSDKVYDRWKPIYAVQPGF